MLRTKQIYALNNSSVGKWQAKYALALWAMTIAPVAIIAALRESSILFATLISLFVLKEKISRTRILSSFIIVIGAFF